MSHGRTLLENWTPEQAARMEKAIFVAQHRLHDLEMFGDESLIKLINSHPRHVLGINTMGADPLRRQDWQEGRASNLTAEELFRAAEQGRIWLNYETHDALPLRVRKSSRQSLCRNGNRLSGLATFNRSANMLISSPEAIVYYHLDCPINMLWRLRGTKRVWAYPLESGIVSDETIEGVLCGENSEELDFRHEWDELAVVYKLRAGEMVT